MPARTGSPSPPLRVVLDELQFRRLVGGQVVALTAAEQRVEVQVILSDIGWRRILRAVLDGVAAEPRVHKGPPDPPQAHEFLPNQHTRRRE
jgi:hypothetical protein